MSAPAPLLELVGVRKEFELRQGLLRRLLGRRPLVIAVDDVDLTVERGEVIGLVGESGSGKSTLAQLAVRLLPVTRGTIRYRGQDVTHRTRRDLRDFRERVQIVFQDSHSSLNPRKTVGQALADPLRLRGVPRRDRPACAAALLAQVGLTSSFLTRYPHELSGGQRQRIGVARALAMSPEFLIADEPVSSLDVSLQAQILNLLARLREELRLTLLLVSHDLAVVNHVCTRVAVMYAGRLVEVGRTAEVLRSPAHPYTQALIAATPAGLAGRARRRAALAGDPPDPGRLPSGCRFAPRCPQVMPVCSQVAPPARALSSTRVVECHLFESQATALPGRQDRPLGTGLLERSRPVSGFECR
jgi:oligopeptide/dipeptide ABC transporter ATP-binding protein